ncbi:myo-inositol catabolism IolB domain-containing protein [Canicola haemoglobinophilus]|uniref:Myo-inositol catabolism IolB domain-containing protein n=1 Tax=Canicola haemoglobinophilus TaxID=733 RepID=A0AB38HGV0_9PAST|nr:5-deoxy-glucuronate isomerase [Canicola haemoglobinophilus]STO54989.1 myo-inositol catabolism IolB domain-containing protein [Canicola haemoglobinophilus]STO69440.1 myo-inositol catabolism IolB domain-containing protein [Canicola haemoglobinophilus]
MSYLLSKSRKNNPAANGEVQKVTPESAGWEYVGFETYHLQEGQTLSFNTETTEACFVLLGGKATIIAGGETYNNIGNRATPFEKIPPYSVYVPHHQQVEIKAETYLELAVCRAPSNGNLPVRLITPEQVGVEQRGFGNNKRLVHNILPETETADALLVVEVFTDEGNTSSYPSHKHDQKDSPNETYLEETYYHRFDPPQGFAMQRVYTDDRTLDECMAVYDGDVVQAPRGYHPVATIAGYNNYYLNVMAGPVRKWKFTWEQDHQWVNSPAYADKFK